MCLQLLNSRYFNGGEWLADKERAIDQTLSLEPRAARQAIEDATFAANRLRTLLPKLQARRQELHDQEQATAWLAKRGPLQRERDALAEELREVYRKAVPTLVDLFVHITANDKALTELGQTIPPGVNSLLSAELHARGLDSFTRDTPSLLDSVVLFDWDSGLKVWPPPQATLASAFAALNMRGPDHRYTADWAEDNERRAAGQQAERQRMADYYARTTKEQEDRENAEAREAFLTSQQKLTRNRPLKS